MRRLLTVLWTLGFIFFNINSVVNGGLSNLQVLYDELMEGYNPGIRPVLKSSDTVQVRANLKMQQIISLDGRREILSFTAQLELAWHDAYLTWNRTQHETGAIVIPASKVWLPDVNIANSAGNVRELNWFQHIYVFVNSSGLIYYKIRSDYSVTCGLDMTYFPFDTQTCNIDVATQELSSYDANLTKGKTDSIILSEYQQNGEWSLVDTTAENREYNFPDKNAPFPYVRFSLHLQRRSMFYILNIILPCIMLSILQLCVFLAPPPSGEKISLSITVLLSFTVFLLMVSESMPQTSQHAPLLGIYLLCILATSTISLIVTVLVLRMYHRNPVVPVPDWLIVAVETLAVVSCQFAKRDKFKMAVRPGTNEDFMAEQMTSTWDDNDKNDNNDNDNKIESVHINGNEELSRVVNVIVRGLSSQTEILKSILMELKKGRENFNREETQGKTWVLAAAILDRSFAILSFVVVVVVNISILFIAPLRA